MLQQEQRESSPQQIRRHLVLGLYGSRQRLGPGFNGVGYLLKHRGISPSWQEQQKSNVWDP